MRNTNIGVKINYLLLNTFFIHLKFYMHIRLFYLFFIFSFFVISAQNNNFVSKWNIPIGAFELPIKNYTDITIDWGDGSSTTHTNAIFPIHIYDSSETFTITIAVNDLKKDIGSMYMNGNHSSRYMILDISNWGEGVWNSFSNAFHGARNLTVSATDEPNLSATTSLLKAFKNCSSLVGTTFKDWDVSTITTMKQLFSGDDTDNNALIFMIFNGDISGWNTAAVTNMHYMFYQCIAFNVGGTQDLNGWNTTAVTNMCSMFNVFGKRDSVFNANVSSWDTANVNNMYAMFQNREVFNSDISSWDTSKVTNMAYMFGGASIFNRNIRTNGAIWNTSNVTDMTCMFSHSKAFNGNISSWNTAQVTNMKWMFYNASSFNRDINTNGDIWNTTAVTDMENMFAKATVFNGDITDWNTAAVINMESMFEDAFAFNKDIRKNGNRWNTRNVTNMKWMFYYARDFNGDIKNWDTRNVTDMELIFYGAYAFKNKVIITIDNWNTTNVITNNPNLLVLPNAKAFKKNIIYIFVLILTALISVLYLIKKKSFFIKKKNNTFIFDTLTLKTPWSIKPLSTNLSEIEKNIAKRYPKKELLEVFSLFEQMVFQDKIFKKQEINIKDFSRATGIPLTHCAYLLKFHINISSFTKFKNFSRVAAALQLIKTNYLVKGTFESLSLDVGFSTYSSFYNAFKIYTSCTPSSYLLSIKK